LGKGFVASSEPRIETAVLEIRKPEALVNKRILKFGVLVSVSAFFAATSAFAQMATDGFGNNLDVAPTSQPAPAPAPANQPAVTAIIPNQNTAATTATTNTLPTVQAGTAEQTQAGNAVNQAVTSGAVYVPQSTYQGAGTGAVGSSHKSSALQTVAMVGAGGLAVWAGHMCLVFDGPIPYPYSCYVAAASAAAAGFLLASKGQTKDAANQMSTGGYQPGYNPGATPTQQSVSTADGGTSGATDGEANGTQFAPGTPEAKVLSQYVDTKAALEKAGYKISPDGQTITGPDGKSMKTSAIMTPQAMAAAGMSADQISAAQAQMAAVAKNAADAVKGVAMIPGSGGGPSGGGGGGSGETGNGTGGDYDGGGAARIGQLRDQNIVMGKSLGSGEETRGIASDDMFRMVHERYKARDATDAFLR
jgi:hypothetical protein